MVDSDGGLWTFSVLLEVLLLKLETLGLMRSFHVLANYTDIIFHFAVYNEFKTRIAVEMLNNVTDVGSW